MPNINEPTEAEIDDAAEVLWNELCPTVRLTKEDWVVYRQAAKVTLLAARRVSSVPSFADGIEVERLVKMIEREFYSDNLGGSASVHARVTKIISDFRTLAHNPQASNEGEDPWNADRLAGRSPAPHFDGETQIPAGQRLTLGQMAAILVGAGLAVQPAAAEGNNAGAAASVAPAPSFADGIDAEGLKREFWHDVGTPSADGRYSNLQIETALKYLVEEVVALAHNPQASSGGYDPTTQPYDEPFRHTDPQRSGAAKGNEAEAAAPISDVPVVAWCYWKPGIPNGYWEFAGAPMVPSSDPLVRRVDHLAVVEKLTRERDEARAREKVLGDKYNEWSERCLVAEAEVKKLRVALSEKENSDAD